MKPITVRVLGISVLAALGVAALAQPTTRAPIQVAPSYIPIGVATSGTATTAWFHNPSTGTVLACQSGPASSAGLGAIQCVTSKLP